ncbi:MAG: hypothetical protein ACRDA3_00095 [Peptostreptococcaceae bacterium]
MEKYFITLDKFSLEEYQIWKLLSRYANYDTNITSYTVNQLVVNSDDRLLLTSQKVRTILKKFEKEGYIQFLTSGSKGKDSTLKLLLKEKLFNNELTTIQQQCNNDIANKSEQLQRVERNDNNNITTIQQLTNNTTKKKKKENNIYTDEFESLWDLYPRKIGKPKAYSMYKKLAKKYGIDKVKECIEIYVKEIEHYGTEERFIKHGSTFFNCMEEDYIKANKKAPTGIGGIKNNKSNNSICNSYINNTPKVEGTKFI